MMYIFTRTICFFALFISLVSSVLADDNLFEFEKTSKNELHKLDINSLIKKYPIYKERAKSFAAKEKKTVEMSGSLYVMQREMAVTGPKDESVTIMGSEEAGSCIVAILRHTGSMATGIISFDTVDIKNGVMKIIKEVKTLTGKSKGTYELSLIGGVKDTITDQIFYQIILAFHKQNLPIKLVLANIGELNSEDKDGAAFPILYGAGVDVRSGEIFPTDSFKYKGPEIVLRGVRLFSAERKVLNIYSYKDRLVKIMPRDFKYKEFPNVDTYLEMSDSDLLNEFSSNPITEPPHFVMQVRSDLQFLKDNPDWKKVVGKPIIYHRVNNRGAWVKKPLPTRCFGFF